MAYQPFPASGAPATAPTSGRRSPVLLIVGVVVLVVGVVAGIVLVLGASSTTEDSVKNLGRAVPAVTTTLDFKETGTFLLFFERQGLDRRARRLTRGPARTSIATTTRCPIRP